MALHGMIFDIDGTLVDTNPAHVEAWRRAFKRLGDVVIGAWEKLALGPAECAMVGDTVYDAQECRGAGVVNSGARRDRQPLAHIQPALRSRSDDHQ